jgi:hypothetical protein
MANPVQAAVILSTCSLSACSHYQDNRILPEVASCPDIMFIITSGIAMRFYSTPVESKQRPT